MDKAQEAAESALAEIVDVCADNGLSHALEALAQDVYGANVARHEPDELGDNAMTLGTLSSQNFKVRALRRYAKDDLEPAEAHWDIPGLSVDTPRNVLTLTIAKARIVTMKVPYSEGRSPRWDRLGNWDYDSQVRLAVAEANSRTLNYNSHASTDDPLFAHLGEPGVVKNFMLVWAGEALDPRTAGWLAVPVMGEEPFLAWRRLWWDEEPTTRLTDKTRKTDGPSFDARPSAMPAVTIRPRPAAEDQA
jgi:hypothetical protein